MLQLVEHYIDLVCCLRCISIGLLDKLDTDRVVGVESRWLRVFFIAIFNGSDISEIDRRAGLCRRKWKLTHLFEIRELARHTNDKFVLALGNLTRGKIEIL